MPTNVIHAGTFDIWPVVGTVIGHESDERVIVAWGGERFSTTPRTSVEWASELRPAR